MLWARNRQVEELRRLWAENRHVKNVFEAVAEGYGGGMTKKEAYKKLLLAGIVSLDFTEEQVSSPRPLASSPRPSCSPHPGLNPPAPASPASHPPPFLLPVPSAPLRCDLSATYPVLIPSPSLACLIFPF